MTPEEVKALMCGRCGEIGELKSFETGTAKPKPWRVMCDRNGNGCCMTYGYATKEEALAAWAKHHEEDEA